MDKISLLVSPPILGVDLTVARVTDCPDSFGEEPSQVVRDYIGKNGWTLRRSQRAIGVDIKNREVSFTKAGNLVFATKETFESFLEVIMEINGCTREELPQYIKSMALTNFELVM